MVLLQSLIQANLSPSLIAEEKRAHPNMPPVIEADTDTLPVLLSHLLKSLSSNGFRLEASVPMPLPVPLVDPFSPFGAQPAHGGGLSSFFNGVLGGGDSEGIPRRGYSREVSPRLHFSTIILTPASRLGASDLWIGSRII